MKPIKQTVYIPVNGEQEKVVCQDYPDWMDTISGVIEEQGYFFTPEQLNQYTQDIIKQALETAAEEATIYRSETDERYDGVNQESITNTFEETFDKFKI